MIVVIADLLIARAAVAEIMALEDAGVLEQLDGAVDGRDRNMRVDGDGAAIELFRIRMIVGLRDHARDDAALLGHAQALVHAGLLDAVQVQGSVHVSGLRAPF